MSPTDRVASGRITRLTPEQEAKLGAWRDRWLTIGLCAEPADRAGAQAGVIAAYAAANLTAPPILVWLRSPLEGALGAVALVDTLRRLTEAVKRRSGGGGKAAAHHQVWDQVRDQVGDQVWAQVGDQVWDQVGDQIWDQVWDQVRDQVRDQVGDQVWDQVRGQVWDQVGAQVRGQVWDQVRGQVWDQVRAQVRGQVWDQVGGQVRGQVWDQVGAQVRGQVWDQVRGQVWDQVGGQVGDQVGGQVRGQVWDQVGGQVGDQVGGQVGDQVWDQVRDQVGAQWNNTCFGQHEAGWLSYLDYFRVVVGLACAERVAGLIRVAECCGWWWPYRGAVLLTERPTRLCRDERGRLHSGDGAAIQYPDGWGVYAWHGVRVPERVIVQPQALTPPEILAERNAEVRRVMIDRFGADRFVLESGARAIHQDETGALYRIDLQDDEPLVLVHVTNATPEPDGRRRTFFLRVPPTMRRAREAVAWTFGMAEREYAPAVES